MTIYSQLRRWWLAVTVGALACVLTVIVFVAALRDPYHRTLPGFDEALALGPILAMLPFGGLHDASVPAPVIVGLGAVANGIIWGIAVAALLYVYRGIRRS